MDSTPFVAVALLDLFEGPLRGVRFPEADGETIAAAADEVRKAQVALAAAQASLEAARAALTEREGELRKRATRALAYARIYAADRPDLLEAIDAVSSKKGARDAPKRPRGRPRKQPSAEAAPATPAHAVS